MQGLLMIDMQRAFDNSSWGERNNPQLEVNSQKLLNFFRERGWPVLHVQHVYTNTQSRFHESQGQDFKDGFQPYPSEPVFQKIVNSAFIRTNLERYLRDKRIDKLVIAGFTLPHCVSTTTRMAANLGFKTSLISDAMASFALPNLDGHLIDPEVLHTINLVSLHDEFAQVMTIEEFMGG
ncbi:MAG: cysteine hydrolase [Streptococcus thermophilus]|uniref:Cysteine hydrolase n=1 Tax=Streptococcus thermophilus TaxID=1308 RepID=A0A3G6JXI0_STRTR|nr:MAG: cysteine hydrolase [Streptococcus thermophilus]AZA22935.1 MAG: cysteine hydrolase [Streptococcus thermophilus]